MTSRKAKLAKYAVAALTGVALSAAFPGRAEAEVAWLLLIPLFIMLRFSTPREGFRLGLLFGLGFWLVSISWLMGLRNNGGPVGLVLFGLIGLSFWCSLFTAFFGLATAHMWRGGDSATGGWRRVWFETWRPAAAALMWCGAEYIRSTLLTGFAWNAVGVSQVRLLPLVQVASLGGVYAVSFLVVLFNASAAGVAVRLWRNTMLRHPDATRRHFDLLVALAVIGLALLWGRGRVEEIRAGRHVAPTFRVAAVDPMLPCIFEEDGAVEQRAAYRNLGETTRTLAAARPELVVWPETVLYTYMPHRALEDDMLRFAADLGVPILAGATEVATNSVGAEVYYNSSFLFGTNGAVEAVYRKQHLVPFGEYIPFDKTLPFLQRLAPTGVSCSAGEAPAVMDVAGVRISPLICFEDTVAGLSRAAVRAGAQVLVAQSNDAWFYGTAEPEQHHAQAVFRAVENGVPMVRCSNRGVTAIVGADGYSIDFLVHFVTLGDTRGRTLYSRFGDWIFGIPCALLFVGILVSAGFGARTARSKGRETDGDDMQQG